MIVALPAARARISPPVKSITATLVSLDVHRTSMVSPCRPTYFPVAREGYHQDAASPTAATPRVPGRVLSIGVDGASG